jgi:hypothetical protein
MWVVRVGFLKKGVDWVVEEFVVVESELGELSYVVEEGGAS